MAKNKPDTTTQPQPPPTAASAPDTGSQLALHTKDELAGLGDDLTFDADGLGPIGRDDVKIATYVLNFGGKTPEGRAVPKDEYYDTVAERSKHKVNAVFLHRHKSNLYSRYIEAEDKTEILCRSSDQITGIWQADGHERMCEGCPDAEWRTLPDGKKKKNCSAVFSMFALDVDESLGFVVRFKRTSLPVIKGYLQKHHIGRRVVRGQRSNYPLYVFAVELSSKMQGQYAVPVINRGRVLTREEIERYRASAREVREIVMPLLAHIDAQANDRDSGEGDTSFDPDKIAADEGRDFADAPA